MEILYHDNCALLCQIKLRRPQTPTVFSRHGEQSDGHALDPEDIAMSLFDHWSRFVWPDTHSAHVTITPNMQFLPEASEMLGDTVLLTRFTSIGLSNIDRKP